jgi:hypothetical protein
MVQEDVSLADDRKNILVGGEMFGDSGIKGGVSVGAINRKLVQRKEITDIDRAIDFVKKLFFNAEPPSQ